MIYLDLPNINTGGTVEEQLAEIRSYIYKNNEQMNATLANLTTDKFWENTANAVSSASNKDETPRLLSQYAKIRDLIIKTATEVSKTEEHYKMLLSGSYLAKSQFGEYLKNTSVEINGESTGFTELYRYSTDLGSDYAELNSVKLDYENYIKRGLLDDTGTTPIYGIELGILENKVVVDGVEHDFNTAYRTRITPDRWSFLYNNSGSDSEVAYITANTIHFPSADISGGSIDIGNGAFKVTSAGVMTATTGTFSGDLSTSKVVGAWNDDTRSSGVKLESNRLSFYSNNIPIFKLTEMGMSFYKRANQTDDVMARFQRLNMLNQTNNTDHYGMWLSVRENIGEFFALGNHTEGNESVIDRTMGVVYVPRQINTLPYPYNQAGLYIHAPISVFDSNGYKHNAVAPATTIKFRASQVWGAVNVTDVDIYMDIVNGIITNISTTA